MFIVLVDYRLKWYRVFASILVSRNVFGSKTFKNTHLMEAMKKGI